MPDAPVPDRPRTRLFCAVLIAAPLLEVVEALISPLTNGTTAQDMAAIAANPTRFATSVVIGIVASLLLLPALLGLAHRCSARSPKLAFAATIACGLVILTFMGVRATQATQLALATSLPLGKATAIFESTTTNPIGLTIMVPFLITNIVSIALLGIALLRSHRVPVIPVILLFLFPVLDWLAPNELGVAVSHTDLTIAFTWIAVSLLRAKPARRERAAAVRPATVDAVAR